MQLWMDLMHTPERRSHPGFCRSRADFGRVCSSNRCVANVTAMKVICLLYALVVRLRNNNILITLENLVPTETVIRFYKQFTRRGGFGGARTLIEDWPKGKYSPNVYRRDRLNFYKKPYLSKNI